MVLVILYITQILLTNELKLYAYYHFILENNDERR